MSVRIRPGALKRQFAGKLPIVNQTPLRPEAAFKTYMKLLIGHASAKQTTAIAWWCFGGDYAAAMRFKRIETRLKKLGNPDPEFRVIKMGDVIIAHNNSTRVELHLCQYTGAFIVVITTIDEELEEFLQRYKGFKAFALNVRTPVKRVRR